MAKNPTENEKLVFAINHLTEKVSEKLLDEFMDMPADQQKNIVLIKATQLLLANILCQVAEDKPELDMLVALQAEELKEIVDDCVVTGFSDKFLPSKH